MSNESELRSAYDLAAEDFLFTRTKGSERIGFQGREIEQPLMFKLVEAVLSGKKLLDVGCGPGIHMKTYVERGAEGFGVDLSGKMIELAKKNCPKGNFSVGSIYELSFKDDFFDVVTASFVLDHVEYLKKGMHEIKRVLRKGGSFIFSIPHPIVHMFRDSDGKFMPTNSYFDRERYGLDVAFSGKIFPEFPRTLNEYFSVFLTNAFTLIDYMENEPVEAWKEKCSGLKPYFFKIPLVAFFKWQRE